MDIHSKETKHTTHKKAARTTHNTSATNTIQDTINRIQDIKHRKTTAYTERTKHEHKEKDTAGN
jgi:hypothetical protein